MTHDSAHRSGLSPGDRLRRVTQFWVELRANDDPGATDWVVLDEIETAVTDALRHVPPDVNRAESLTFKALHLMAGNIES